jgi:hypothetical protein
MDCQALTGGFRAPGGITRVRVSSGPMRAARQGGDLKQNLMASANSEPTSEIVLAPFLPALLKFGDRCDGTGAVPGRQSHEKPSGVAPGRLFSWS